METGVLVGIGATLAVLVAIIKSAFPSLPSRTLPLVVLALAIVVIGVGAWSGDVQGSLFDLMQLAVAQAAIAVGIREGAITAVPKASSLIDREPKPLPGGEFLPTK